MTVCLGIDPSSTTAGLAIADAETIYATSVWTRPTHGDQTDWLLDFLVAVRMFISVNKAYGIQCAMIEYDMVQRNGKVTRMLGRFEGVAVVACKGAGIPTFDSTPAHTRKIALPPGWGKSKEEAGLALKAMFPDADLDPLDKADAAIAAICGAKDIKVA